MRLIDEALILQGLRNREFVLHYQPKTSLVTNRVIGAEALVRWHLPDGTVLTPMSFLPETRHCGLMKDLTLQLLDQLVQDLTGNSLGEGMRIALNVTAEDFEDDTLTASLFRAIANPRFMPHCLELEITETQALAAGDHVLGRINALAGAGIGFAMDDYGIGYSSIDTLSQWPFTSIKLDQGIVGRMLTSAKSATIVHSSIRLGHELGLDVVAEGVETVEQHNFLIEAGCKLIQGYLISRPLPAAQFRIVRDRLDGLQGFPIGLAYMAIVDHIQWRRRMVRYALKRSALLPDDPARQIDDHPPLCVTQCALGRWYVNEGRYFSGTPMYHALSAPHCALHDAGHGIVDLVKSGASYPDLIPLLRDLNNASVELIRLLEDIEDNGLHALYAAP